MEPSVPVKPLATIAQVQTPSPVGLSITQGENNMAEMLSDPTLHTEHAAIRHDIGLAEANIRDKVGAAACGLEQSIGQTRFEVGNQAGRLAQQIGSEACGINKHIGDMRQEDAENFGHTRRDIQGTSADIRREQAVGFGDTRYNIAERAGDIRREGAEHTNEIVKEGLRGDFNTRGDIKDTRYDLSTRITNSADRITDRLVEHDAKVADRFFAVGRDLASIAQGQATLAKDVELNALKTQLDAKANTQYLADKIVGDGERTRALINDLKYHDLNRGLVERNTALVNCEQDRDNWKYRCDDYRWSQRQDQFGAQFAQLQTQIQAFASQLQETRQGMVNFGTMSGNSGQQSSTSNNVR